MMLALICFQAISQGQKFFPPIYVENTVVLKKALEREYLYHNVKELSAGSGRVTYVVGGRTSGITVVDILVYVDYKPRGTKTGSKVLAAYLYGRSGNPRARIVKANGHYALQLEYLNRSNKKITEVISLSLSHPLYKPM